MKRLFFLVVGIVLVGGIAFFVYSSQTTPNIQEEIDQIEVPVSDPVAPENFSLIEVDKIKIVLFNNVTTFDLLNENNTMTLNDYLKTEDLSVVVNGGYFTPDQKFVGYLYDGSELAKLSRGNVQATHIAVFDNESKRIFFVDSNLFESAEYITTGDLAFQSGPIILDKNILQTTFIDKSLNGNGSYYRTFLGKTESGKVFVGVTTDIYDLRKLGEAMLQLNEFKGEVVSVLNLDGGTSTAMSVKNNEPFSFRGFRLLPFYLGID